MGSAIKHHVLDWVKQSFVIFNIRALSASECPDVKNYERQLNPVWSGTGWFIAVSIW